MADRVNRFLVPEWEAVEELQRRLAVAGRASAFVLAGPREGRLGAMLRAVADRSGGHYVDLAQPEHLTAMREAPPLFGRDLLGRLSDTVLRQFLMREARINRELVLAVHIPELFWRVMAGTDPDGPRRFLRGLREWPDTRGLVLSYPLVTNSSTPAIEELTGLLGPHLVALTLTAAERRYLEGEREETGHAEQ